MLILIIACIAGQSFVHRYFCLAVAGAALLLSACDRQPPPTPSAPEPAFVGSVVCRDCHGSEYADWQDSHHDLAMQVATADTVLGNFDAATFAYFDTETHFLSRDGNFFVHTEDSDGEGREFRVAYAFGVYPLQQYLVETDNGRLQAMPFAWDARNKDVGGQRWYHLYPDEYVGPGDPLHWTGRYQNWNYMCAECHSTNLQVNYDVASDSFATSWSGIDVGCEACHGPGAIHVHQAEVESFSGDRGFPLRLDDRGRASWQMNLQTGIAERSELLLQPPIQPEACGRCHARRGLIAAEYEYGEPLAETHRVAHLSDPLYFDDGQIRDEVYVYGSFLQSRMYAAGVTCSDCHNPHSTRLVTGDEPSDVCGQCHWPGKFASADHHHHEPAEASCVDCHMTSRVYMGVDARRDHSFRIPRPDLTASTGAPNACNACHGDNDAAWAAEQVRTWRGGQPGRPHFATALHNARNGFANAELVAAIDDSSVPGIARGTALTLLAGPLGREEAGTVERALRDGDVLVRLGALRAARLLPPELQVQLATPVLKDGVRSARIEAAVLLAPLQQGLPAAAAAAFRGAADEFRDAQLATASWPEAHMGLGDFEANLGNAAAARRHYQQALEMEPDSPVTRVNFADALRRFGDESHAETVLREGIRHDDSNAPLRHSLGLLLARSNRSDDGIVELRRATELEPGNSRYIYVLAIALNSAGDSAQAAAVLETAWHRFPGDFDIAWALATISRDRGDQKRAAEIARQLVGRYPDNPNVTALLESLPGS